MKIKKINNKTYQVKKMKLLQIILILLFFTSCSSVGKKTILYGKCSRGYLACNQFELKKNKTFEYYSFMDVGGGYVLKGNWDYVNGDTLKLNTFEQPNITKTYFDGAFNSNLKNKIKIKISDYEGPLEYFDIKINDGEFEERTDMNGICFFKVSEIKNITFTYYLSYSSRTETIVIDNPKINDVEIFVSDYDESDDFYFVDKLVVATKEKIILDPNEKRKFELGRAKFERKWWKH